MRSWGINGSPLLARRLRFGSLVTGNVIVDGRRTSMRLEPAMWSALCRIAEREEMTIHDLCTEIDRMRDPSCGLTAAIRVFLMSYFEEAATEEGHAKAGHGTPEDNRRTGTVVPLGKGPAAA
jgi:predicted DNA-binding ribbon-helix-helix protein